VATQAAEAATVAADLEAPGETADADELRRIEGIGPKIAGVLQAAGITTFAQLADTDVGRLQEILNEAGISRIADPGTWPEQAKLAADGDWAGLEALQDQLEGGRRTGA
jgi:predicted flap endonuclease-1-like 5' DNA nuclease